MLRFPVFLLALMPFWAFASTSANPASLQELMSTWLALESQRSHLVTQWHERKQHLENRIVLLERETEVLSELLEQTSTDVSEVDERRQQLISDQQALEKEQDSLRAVLDRAVIRLAALLPTLPPPLQESWRSGINQLQQDTMTLSEQLEKILTLNKSAEQFERRVAVHSEVMALPFNDGERSVQVTQVYLGLSQGWYVNATGERFGYGSSDGERWHWQHMDKNSGQEAGVPVDPELLLRILAMLDNPTKAEFITLPVKH